MKQGSFRAVRHIVCLLIMLSVAVFSVSGDDRIVDLMSVILDNFNGGTNHEWTVAGRTYSYDFEWALDASKFTSNIDNDAFPKLTYVDAWPMALYGSSNRNNRNIRSLGIWGRFDRRGYNWIDIYPIVAGSGGDDEEPIPFEIPIPGRVRSMDMWVWGSNHNYYLEAYFRDYQGVVHTLYMGDLAHHGWKNLRVNIPNHIPQARRTLPLLANLQFVKFRIWTMPLERVDNFYVYFNQMKILTDIHESLYDGDDLADPSKVLELWARN